MCLLPLLTPKWKQLSPSGLSTKLVRFIKPSQVRVYSGANDVCPRMSSSGTLPLKLDTQASLPSMKSHSFKELPSTQTLRSRRRRRFVFKVHALIVENLINFRPNHYTAVEFELITVIMAQPDLPGRDRDDVDLMRKEISK